MNRVTLLQILRPSVVSALLGAVTTLGCQGERMHADQAAPVASAVPAKTFNAISPPPMSLYIGDVRADPTLDSQAIRSTMRDAERAFLACLPSDGSTGVIALSFPIERDGSVGDIVEGVKTTYFSEDARVCIERLIAVMRFPVARRAGPAQVEVAPDARNRHPGA